MSNEVDPFRLNQLYPEADAIFSVRVKPFSSIKDDCIFILDTNVLLLPYTISAKGIGLIGKAYEGLIGKKRLVLPGQVAREFARQRPERIKELYDRIHQKRSKAPTFEIESYPILEGVEAYDNVKAISGKIGPEVKAYLDGLDEILRTVRGWGWDDPISVKYKDLFLPDVIVDPQFDQSSAFSEMKRRYVNEIPPGYKDGSKADDGIGDYLIWKTILHVAEDRKANIVFVTGDEKSDWFHRSAGKSLYPRFELVAEFQRKAPGKTFHIIQFHELMEGLGTDDTIVAEIKVQEEGIKHSAPYQFSGRKEHIRLAEVARNWIQHRFSLAYDMHFKTVGFPDVVLKSQNGETKIGIDIVVVPKNDNSLGLRFFSLIQEIRKSIGDYEKIIVIFVCADNEDSLKTMDVQAADIQQSFADGKVEVVKLSVNGSGVMQR